MNTISKYFKKDVLLPNTSEDNLVKTLGLKTDTHPEIPKKYSKISPIFKITAPESIRDRMKRIEGVENDITYISPSPIPFQFVPSPEIHAVSSFIMSKRKKLSVEEAGQMLLSKNNGVIPAIEICKVAMPDAFFMNSRMFKCEIEDDNISVSSRYNEYSFNIDLVDGDVTVFRLFDGDEHTTVQPTYNQWKIIDTYKSFGIFFNVN